MFGPCSVIQYLVSLQVLQSFFAEERAGCFIKIVFLSFSC